MNSTTEKQYYNNEITLETLNQALLDIATNRKDREKAANELEEAQKELTQSLDMSHINIDENAYDRQPRKLPRSVVRQRRKQKFMDRLKILFGMKEPEY